MGFLSKLFGFSKPAPKSEPTSVYVKPSIELTVTSSSYYVEVKQHTKGLLPSLPTSIFDDYVSPSGGYINFARYQAYGVKPSTGRKNKRVFEARNEDEVIMLMKKDGLVEPFEITVLPSKEPTENQLEFARTIRAVLPDGACFLDVSAIISRITDKDEDPANETVARIAHNYGVKFSLYSGTKAIKEMAQGQLAASEYRDFKSLIK